MSRSTRSKQKPQRESQTIQTEEKSSGESEMEDNIPSTQPTWFCSFREKLDAISEEIHSISGTLEYAVRSAEEANERSKKMKR